MGIPLLLFAMLMTNVTRKGVAQVKNGFDLTNASVDAEKIKSGGPPRDGIPSLDNPKFILQNQADYLEDSDRVLGIRRNGMAKAYPIRILTWHEIVNDRVGNEPVLVTYCPLCGSGMAFKSTVANRNLEFGVSGLLYNSDVIMYDRQTESLWPQLKAKAISGPLKGMELEQIPLTHTTWKDWVSKHPETKVLSKKTGYNRNYNKDPYAGYEDSRQTYFPVDNQGDDYHPKDLVMGVIQGEEQVAYPFPELENAKVPFEDQIDGKKVTVHFDEENRSGRIVTENGEELPSVTMYWFAWSAFYPDGKVYKN